MYKRILSLIVVGMLLVGCNMTTQTLETSKKQESSIKETTMTETLKETSAPKETTTVAETTQKEEKDNKITMSLINLFPNNIGDTMVYMGSYEYCSFDMVIDIKDHEEGDIYKEVVIQTEPEDLSGGEAGDLSSVNRYRTTEEAVYKIYSDGSEAVLLQNPIEVGHTWETIEISNGLGLQPIMRTITEVDGNRITTETKLINELYYTEVNQYIKKVEKYEIGRGLTYYSVTLPAVYGDEETYEFAYSQSGEIIEKPKFLIDKYIHVDERLKDFYQYDSMVYDELIGTSKQWAHEHFNLTAQYNYVDEYKEILDSLDISYVESISAAAEIGNAFILYNDLETQILEVFEDYYARALESISSRFEDTAFLRDLYAYSEYEGMLTYRYETEDIIEHAQILRLKENGIGIMIIEGTPILIEYPGFISGEFYNIQDESILDYLYIMDEHLRNLPLVTEGQYNLSMNETAEMILLIENFYKEHPYGYSTERYEDIYYAMPQPYNMGMFSGIYKSAYIIPFNLMDDGKYDRNTFKASDELMASYSEYISYKDSEIQPIIKEVYTMLQDNDNTFSLEIYNYLESQGFVVDVNNESFYNDIFPKLK